MIHGPYICSSDWEAHVKCNQHMHTYSLCATQCYVYTMVRVFDQKMFKYRPQNIAAYCVLEKSKLEQ